MKGIGQLPRFTMTLKTWILISWSLSLVGGCSILNPPKPDPPLLPPPQARIQLPSPPEKTEIKGAVPVGTGSTIVNSKGETKYTVRKGGGAFLPKIALEDLDFREKLWHYYSDAIVASTTDYNKKVDLNNNILKDLQKTEKPKGLWERLVGRRF